MTAVLHFPLRPAAQRRGGESAAPYVDAILRTDLSRIEYRGELHILAEGAKQIRDLFRGVGWSRYFRVTKGCWSLGPSIEWAKDYRPAWECEHTQEIRRERLRASAYSPPPYCTCDTCTHRRAQRDAISRRVAYLLNKAFHKEGTRPVGDHSDLQTDYSDADYTFHP